MASAKRANPPAFIDVASSSGLRYRWSIPGPRPMNILQTIGNGCAFLDYDNDGSLDILLVGSKLALYRGDGHGRFTDVTRSTGLDELRQDFRGCAVGDYDNDGFDDLYLSAYRGGALLHNDGGKRFLDVTRTAGVEQRTWSTSCVFVDFDNDGLLDLYVGNYVEFGPHSEQLCEYMGRKAACPPGKYGALKGRMYRNRGDGRFEDVTKKWGFGSAHGKALAAAALPLTPGAHPSLAIANDAVPGDMMTLQGNAAVNTALAWGTASLGGGVAYGGMGVDWGDYDNDGKIDLVVATYVNQAKPIFRNLGGVFELQSCERLGMVTAIPRVNFGIKWIDYDNDGWLDILMANGHIQDNVAEITMSPGIESTYRQPSILYHNVEGGRFEDLSSALQGGAGREIVGRGVATGDYDNDGRVDALVVDSEGAPLLLHNVAANPGHWLTITLIGRTCNRDGYGAIVTAQASGRTLVRHCHADGSYASSSDKRIHFGLGSSAKVERLTITWPNGHVDHINGLHADRTVTIREGEGRVE